MQDCKPSQAAIQALGRRPADGYELLYSTFRFRSSSGGLFTAGGTGLELFSIKQGEPGQGFVAALDYTQTNLQISKELPENGLLRRLGFAWKPNTIDDDKVLLSGGIAINIRTDGNKDHWQGLLQDWMSLPDFGAAEAVAVPAAGPGAAVDKRWVVSCCRMRDLLTPFELRGERRTFSVNLVFPTAGVQSGTASAHDAEIYCRLEWEPLD